MSRQYPAGLYQRAGCLARTIHYGRRNYGSPTKSGCPPTPTPLPSHAVEAVLSAESMRLIEDPLAGTQRYENRRRLTIRT